MPTTTDQPTTFACPFWCTSHEDMNRPAPRNVAALATYDETVDCHFVHASDDVTIGDKGVSVSICTDWNGRDIEPPTVFLDGHDLTVDEARQLARALLDASLRILEPSLAERMGSGKHPAVSAALDAKFGSASSSPVAGGAA